MKVIKFIIILLFICSCRSPEAQCYLIVVEKHQLMGHPYAHYKIVIKADNYYDPFWMTDLAKKYEIGDTLNLKK